MFQCFIVTVVLQCYIVTAVLQCYIVTAVLQWRYKTGVCMAKWLHTAHVGKVWKCGKCPNVMAVLKPCFIIVTALLQCYRATSLSAVSLKRIQI